VTKPTLTPPSGTRDFLPQESIFRSSVFSIVKTIFSRHGFAPFETPAFERLETLSGKYGDEGEKLIYKILKRGEKGRSGEADMALRYDLTVPTMRLFSHRRNELPRIVKRYQIGPVWRADRPGRGRFREFCQCDVDIIGSASPLADIEVLLTLSGALNELGLEEFKIRLNSRQALRGLMTAYRLPDASHGAVLTVLDKLDKIGVDGVVDSLSELGLNENSLGDLISDLRSGHPNEALRTRIQSVEEGRDGLALVNSISDYVAPFLGSKASIIVDPFLARGLDYYTGPIFEFVAEGGVGSIAGGGRYDNLSRLFMKERVPVCGGSLGIERIILLLSGKTADKTAVRSGCYVTVWDENSVVDALNLCRNLRSRGLVADMDVEGGKLGRQMKMADERGSRIVTVQGPDEKVAGEVTIKDMESGQQRRVREDEVVAIVEAILD
jgi:histidyl-tRNA synthetase